MVCLRLVLALLSSPQDLKNLTSMFDRFVQLDRKFVGTWQERLIKGCMAAFEDNDWKAFTQVIYEQDKIHKVSTRCGTGGHAEPRPSGALAEER